MSKWMSVVTCILKELGSHTVANAGKIIIPKFAVMDK